MELDIFKKYRENFFVDKVSCKILKKIPTFKCFSRYKFFDILLFPGFPGPLMFP